jgi:hypothetical protein
MSYKQTTRYGRKYKYDTFDFKVPEFAELLKKTPEGYRSGYGYILENHGGKRWIYLPDDGKFTIVIKSDMDYMDKLKKANKNKGVKNEDRNAS